MPQIEFSERIDHDALVELCALLRTIEWAAEIYILSQTAFGLARTRHYLSA